MVARLLFASFCSAVGYLADGEPRCSSGRVCPHIVMVVVDDLGWNNVPWHNPDLEEHLPHSLQLVREGVELDRHYTYVYCSPTRSSLMSGRLPHHVNQINLDFRHELSGIPKGMITIPRKLKDAGYRTHMTGKWHCGSATPEQTPHGRGFDTHLGYFEGAEDHFTQLNCVDEACFMPDSKRNLVSILEGLKNPDIGFPGLVLDLWATDGPARGMTGTYGDEMFGKFAVDTINAHPLDLPLFLYVAFQSQHTPLEVPEAYLKRFPAEWNVDRRLYAAMGVYWDERLGYIAEALKARDMWNHTLLVVTSDNGGAIYPSHAESFKRCGGANNHPLFGGKTTSFEGGVRVAAFASGGLIPAERRGRKLEGNIHVADWFATFCGLAGVAVSDPAGVAAGLPDVDSQDVWPLLTQEAATSPRLELPLQVSGAIGGSPGLGSALIVGDFKLIAGNFLHSAFHQPEVWPTDEACCGPDCFGKKGLAMDCGPVDRPQCLFNIRDDPHETTNLYDQEPALVANMTARLAEHNRSVYFPQLHDKPNMPRVVEMFLLHGGFVGPWKDIHLV